MNKPEITELEIKIEEENYCELILKFKAPGEHTYLDQYIKEYSDVRVMESAEEYENYLDGLGISFEEIPDSEYKRLVIEKGYSKEPQSMVTHNFNKLLEYDEETEVYTFAEYIDLNPLTEAAIQMLKDYKDNKEFFSSRDDTGYLISILESLNNFWY